MTVAAMRDLMRTDAFSAASKPISATRGATANRSCDPCAVADAFMRALRCSTPPLLDDADSVHAEVAREMIVRHDWVTLYANGIRYLEKAPLLYWGMAASFQGVWRRGQFAARLPLALDGAGCWRWRWRALRGGRFGASRAGMTCGADATLSSFGIFIFTRITIPDVMVCLWLTLAMFCYWLMLTEAEERPSPHGCAGALRRAAR